MWKDRFSYLPFLLLYSGVKSVFPNHCIVYIAIKAAISNIVWQILENNLICC